MYSIFYGRKESQVRPPCLILLHLHPHRLLALVRCAVSSAVSMLENHTLYLSGKRSSGRALALYAGISRKVDHAM